VPVSIDGNSPYGGSCGARSERVGTHRHRAEGGDGGEGLGRFDTCKWLGGGDGCDGCDGMGTSDGCGGLFCRTEAWECRGGRVVAAPGEADRRDSLVGPGGCHAEEARPATGQLPADPCAWAQSVIVPPQVQSTVHVEPEARHWDTGVDVAQSLHEENSRHRHQIVILWPRASADLLQ